MKVQDRLKRFVDETPDVTLVAFCDVSSGLILNWSGKTSCPREVLDRLGEKAAASLAMLDGRAGADGNAIFGTAAIRFDARGAQIFARSAPRSEDVICVECGPGAPLEDRLRAAMRLAQTVAGPE